MSNYRGQIMNISVAPAHKHNRPYKEGHCNARHAAAEIANAADAQIEKLEDCCKLLAKLAATGPAFSNPLEAMAAEKLRDVLLDAMGLQSDGTIKERSNEL